MSEENNVELTAEAAGETHAAPSETPAEAGPAAWASIAGRIEALEQAANGLAETVAGLARSQAIMQGAMRQLAVKVGEAATSLAPPRIYSLYMRLLMLYDMVSPPPAGFSEDAQRLAAILANQIEEFLAGSGFERIRADGEPFDPAIHRSVDFVTAEDPTQAGRVVAIRRNGFRSGAQVLRPAEVTLARAEVEPAKTALPNSEAQISTKNPEQERN